MWLDVPYAEKDPAKGTVPAGNPSARRWYAPEGRGGQLQAWTALPGLPDPVARGGPQRWVRAFRGPDPASCWFTNVRVKILVVGRAGHRYEVCGAAAEPSRGLWLEAHERWAYDDATRVQALRRLVCLCTRCHRTTHFGYAEITGQAVQAHAHLRTVNRWNVITADDQFAAAVRTWQHRSAVDWSLDLSLPTAAGVVPSPAPTAPTRRRVASDTLDRTTRDKR